MTVSELVKNSVYIFLFPFDLLSDKKFNLQAIFNPDLVLVSFQQPIPDSFHKLFIPFVLKMELNLLFYLTFQYN